MQRINGNTDFTLSHASEKILKVIISLHNEEEHSS